MKKKIHYLWLSILLGLLVCFFQIRGSSLFIYGCMAALVGLIAIATIDDYTLPVLLFFLPWMPIMRANPNSFSFFTVATVLVCAIRIYKTKFYFERYQVVTLLGLLALTLLVRLLDSNMLDFSYIFFMMYIALFPVCKMELEKKKYDFYHVVVMFAAGCTVAALCAQTFAGYPNIAKYINISSFSIITRMCGFYGDPNFYCAQITAAIGGCLVLLIKEKKRSHLVVLGILTFGLVYCGFLSGSKSFLLSTAAMLVMWFIKLMREKGTMGRKIVLIVVGSLAVLYVLTSQLFSGLLEVILTRLSWSDNASDFTTGRTELWDSYIQAMMDDLRLLFLGRGYANIKINGRASHSSLLQMIYQFGLVGAPLLCYWLVSYFRDLRKILRKQTLYVLILLMGTVVPWLMIDILFCDDFFLLMMYLFVAGKYLLQEQKE